MLQDMLHGRLVALYVQFVQIHKGYELDMLEREGEDAGPKKNCLLMLVLTARLKIYAYLSPKYAYIYQRCFIILRMVAKSSSPSCTGSSPVAGAADAAAGAAVGAVVGAVVGAAGG